MTRLCIGAAELAGRSIWTERREMLAALRPDLQAAALRDVTRLSLLNELLHWRDIRLLRAEPEMSPYVQLVGELPQPREAALVVFSHFGPLSALALVLKEHRGLLLTQYVAEWVRDVPNLTAELVEPGQPNVAALYRCREHLLSGALLLLAGDAHQERTAVSKACFGRALNFPRGYAELALRTGASVHYVFARSRPDGHVEVEFIRAPEGAPTADDLVSDYVRRFEEQLTAHPAMVPAHYLRLGMQWRAEAIAI